MESDRENDDAGSEGSSSADQPLYSAAAENFLSLREPTPEDFQSCQPASSLIKRSTLSFTDTKTNITDMWPLTEVKNVRVKKAFLTSIEKDKWPLATVKSVTPAAEDDLLRELDVRALSLGNLAEDRLQEAEKLLVQFQQVYKIRSISVQELEEQVDDQVSQLKDSEVWNNSPSRRIMSLTARISEQETVILQLGQELNKEKEKRRKEAEAAFQSQ